MKMQIFQIDQNTVCSMVSRRTKVIVAVHGNQSSKTDVPVRILAETASRKKGIRYFDLPEHGRERRRGIPVRCRIVWKN